MKQEGKEDLTAEADEFNWRERDADDDDDDDDDDASWDMRPLGGVK